MKNKYIFIFLNLDIKRIYLPTFRFIRHYQDSDLKNVKNQIL